MQQEAISHGRTDTKMISLDAQLHMEGLPPLILWGCVVDVLSPADNSGRDSTRNLSQVEPPHSIDLVPPNIKTDNNRVQLYVFEENEAVMKIISKGRRARMAELQPQQSG